MLNKTTITPRRICRKELQSEMKQLGIKTSGSDTNMEKILKRHGFGLPSQEGEYFGFILNKKYIYCCFNYSDALANELILLKKLNMI